MVVVMAVVVVVLVVMVMGVSMMRVPVNIPSPSPAVAWAIVDEPELMIAHCSIVSRRYSYTPPLRHSQQSLPGFLS